MPADRLRLFDGQDVLAVMVDRQFLSREARVFSPARRAFCNASLQAP